MLAMLAADGPGGQPECHNYSNVMAYICCLFDWAELVLVLPLQAGTPHAYRLRAGCSEVEPIPELLQTVSHLLPELPSPPAA